MYIGVSRNRQRIPAAGQGESVFKAGCVLATRRVSEERVLDRVMERGREILDSPIYDLSDEDDTGGDDEAAANEVDFNANSFSRDNRTVLHRDDHR